MDWFKIYKIPAGSGENKFAFNDEAKNKVHNFCSTLFLFNAVVMSVKGEIIRLTLPLIASILKLLVFVSLSIKGKKYNYTGSYKRLFGQPSLDCVFMLAYLLPT